MNAKTQLQHWAVEGCRALFEQASCCRDTIARLDAEMSCVVPGHTVDGYETFVAEKDGAFMLRFYRDYRSAFVWKEGGQWMLRPWSDVAIPADDTILNVPTFEHATQVLLGFDHSVPTPSRIERDEADRCIAQYLGDEQQWLQKERELGHQ